MAYWWIEFSCILHVPLSQVSYFQSQDFEVSTRLISIESQPKKIVVVVVVVISVIIVVHIVVFVIPVVDSRNIPLKFG